MTVYELIKELVDYPPDSEVEFLAEADIEIPNDENTYHMEDSFCIYEVRGNYKYNPTAPVIVLKN